MSSSVEIVCSACGVDTFVRREPIYEGFQKTGERFLCAACGHEFESEEDVPYKFIPKTKIFSDADRVKKIEIFESDERGRNCRYCRHYVVNPFIQRCGLHHREVQATDICDDFNPPELEQSVDGDTLQGESDRTNML